MSDPRGPTWLIGTPSPERTVSQLTGFAVQLLIKLSKVAKFGKSGENHSLVSLLDFSIFLGGPGSLGRNVMNISFSRAFERAVWHFNLNFDIKKVPLLARFA